MTANLRRDLNISGVLGGAGGGEFNVVSINGHGTIDGSLDCIGFVCNGRATVNGPLLSETVEVNGSTSFNGKLDAGRMRVNGKSDIAGPMAVRDFRVDGHAKVGGHLSGEEIEVNGYLTVKGNCDAESFRSHGCFRIDGLLNAGTIEVNLMFAECRAKEIGGETITVRRTGNGSAIGKLVKALVFSQDALVADAIEGDDVRLEYTKAGVVRGTNVVIGPGSEIGLVEYKDNLSVHTDAKVSASKQL
ncbi:cytoplasmic protein [Paenibacillus flagellatus]|uniref:cytoplasmic protein n=1 Tax=Paenibacillus flagellatus TaxID=2211139 RepID=UPI0011B7B628|nr:cytoplasmic protein [Paenibacillus flagellatus]